MATLFYHVLLCICAQAQLHDYVVRLSAVPAVQGVLESISEAQRMLNGFN